MEENEEIKRHEDGIVIGSEPIEYIKGSTLIFMIHGFSSSPDEFRELANYLRDKNISVVAPLLPKHGIAPEKLNDTNQEELYEYAERTLKRYLNQEKFRKVLVLGNCSGGNIAIKIAAAFNDKIDGLILVSTPIFFRYNWIYRIIHPAFKIYPGYYIKLGKDPKVKKAMIKGNTYARFPMKWMYDIYMMAKESKNEIKKVEKPILIIQSSKDHVVHPKSASYIKVYSKSEKKKMVMFDKKCHVLLRHNVKNDVNIEILSFIENIGKLR